MFKDEGYRPVEDLKEHNHVPLITMGPLNGEWVGGVGWMRGLIAKGIMNGEWVGGVG